MVKKPLTMSLNKHKSTKLHVTPPIIAVIAVIVTLALVRLTKRATSTKTGTFQATATDRRKETNITYMEFFMSTIKHIRVTDRRLQAETAKEAYEAIDIGATANVA